MKRQLAAKGDAGSQTSAGIERKDWHSSSAPFQHSAHIRFVSRLGQIASVRRQGNSSGPTNSPEFALALRCCKHAFSRPLETSAGFTEGVNWRRFLQMAHFHRIEGMAWQFLASVRPGLPDDIGQELNSASIRVAASNLRAAHACRLLLDAFDGAGIPLLFLKGLTVGALAYGNPAIKSSIDIDLLIDPNSLREAAGLLRHCGYRLVAPSESPGDGILHRWHRGWKESVWRNDASRLQIDLHTRTADNRRLIPAITAQSPRQTVNIGQGLELPTLADDELFAYLAVHGASSAWFRLKWIADFAGYLSPLRRGEIDRLYERSQQLGAGRAAGQALLLAHDLFGTLEENEDLRRRLSGDPSTRRLYRAALRLLTGEPVEPTARRWGTLAIHSAQLRLLPGLGYKLSEISRQAGRFIDRPPA